MNQGYRYRERIPAAAHERPVLEYLTARYRHSTSTEWEARLRSGRVRLDGAPATAAARLRTGQTLTWDRPPWREPMAPLGFAVLYRDDEILAVAKPGGLPTVPGGGFLTHTLLHQVRRRYPDAAPLHRLGRATSGVVLLARSPAARRHLTQAWRAYRVRRLYRAWVIGTPAERTFEITVPIGLVPHPVLGAVHAAHPDGRHARTIVRRVRASAEGSLVEVEIETGRPHQIRIHLAAAGHALVGDPLYGAGGLPRPGVCALPGAGGFFLHAASITFPHHRTGRATTVACPGPACLRDHG